MFTQAYCTSPVCGPARSSIISGRMPHETGVEWNGDAMKDDIMNAGEIFRMEGYQTVWAGKWHLPVSYPQKANSRQKETKGFDISEVPSESAAAISILCVYALDGDAQTSPLSFSALLIITSYILWGSLR